MAKKNYFLLFLSIATFIFTGCSEPKTSSVVSDPQINEEQAQEIKEIWSKIENKEVNEKLNNKVDISKDTIKPQSNKIKLSDESILVDKITPEIILEVSVSL